MIFSSRWEYVICHKNEEERSLLPIDLTRALFSILSIRFTPHLILHPRLVGAKDIKVDDLTGCWINDAATVTIIDGHGVEGLSGIILTGRFSYREFPCVGLYHAAVEICGVGKTRPSK
jgi:hypothetical protein